MKSLVDKAIKLKHLALPRSRPLQRKPTDPVGDVLDCCIAYNLYGGYCVPLSAFRRPAVQRILHAQVYEPDTIEFMRDHCGDGDIVHAGTFFGDFLPGLSTACGADSTVWAFEPNPNSFRCAEITAKINDLHNVVLTNAGLGDRPQKAMFQVSGERGIALGGGSHFVGETPADKDGCLEVSITRIDDVVPQDRNVSIIHLDVEGYEKEALSGAVNTITRCRPVLILEFAPDVSWFVAQLPGVEYEIVGKVHRNTVLAPKGSLESIK